MYKVVSGSFLFIILIDSCTCWVMNEIDFEKVEFSDYEFEIDDLDSDDVAMRRFNLIYPGTKWCGSGNIADNNDDLGTSKEADMCCRDHDNCPDVILAGETKHNLTNTAFYSRLHCDCDESFKTCLVNANTTTARRIGKLYFNTIGTKCYRMDYPVTGCSSYGGWFKTKCLQYTYDTNGEKLYQWFDVSKF